MVIVNFFWFLGLLFLVLKKNNVDIPNCLTTVSTSYGNCFQYAGVPFTELINGNALSLATNSCSFKIIFSSNLSNRHQNNY